MKDHNERERERTKEDERGCFVSGSGMSREKVKKKACKLEYLKEKGLKVKTRVRHVLHLGLAAIWS